MQCEGASRSFVKTGSLAGRTWVHARFGRTSLDMPVQPSCSTNKARPTNPRFSPTKLVLTVCQKNRVKFQRQAWLIRALPASLTTRGWALRLCANTIRNIGSTLTCTAMARPREVDMHCCKRDTWASVHPTATSTCRVLQRVKTARF